MRAAMLDSEARDDDSMRALLANVGRRPLFVGVVHLRATPGAPGFDGDAGAVLAAAERDAAAFVNGGVDALIVENYGDTPFFARAVPAETIATLALAVERVARVAESRPIGVNVLRNDARAALGLCAVGGASFLRVNVHTGAMVTDQGVLEGDAANTLRERARLAPGAVIAADVHVKHATPLGSETLEDAADDVARRGGADVLVVSGSGTGRATAAADIERVRERVPEVPIWIGSGLAVDAASEASLRLADGAIVGTSLYTRSPDGAREVDASRVARMRALFDRVRP